MAPDGVVRNMLDLLATLDGYASILEPWAASVAGAMLADVRRRDERMWRRQGLAIGRALRQEISSTPQGELYRELMEENVDLITSLPRRAGQRVHQLTEQALVSGRRAESISKEILETGKVTRSRARLIARTEVARSAAMLVQARAQRAGSTGYIWRTSRDADVRDTHKAMEGRFVRWDSPPKTDPSLDPYHAGCGPNCRCYAEPVFPEFD